MMAVADRLTKAALKQLNRWIVAPYIIKPKKPFFTEIRETIREFISQAEEYLPRFLTPPPILGSFPLRELPLTGFIASILPRDLVENLADDDRIEKIFPDALMFTLQYPTVPPEGIFETRRITFTTTFWTKKLVGADEANKQGYTGHGITVAVVDTGASRIHQQIRDKVEFHTTIPTQYRDENGHGTWCATCIGGNLAKDTYLSRRTKQDVICEGIAPKCKILAIKSLGYYIGTGTSSQVIEGIEYAISRKANILSMSLGRSEPEEEKPEDDPYYYAFEKCEEAGLIPVVANGNDGPNEGTVGSPGNMPNCLSVGAWNPITGNVADFSSRGPTKWGDIKPDCIMPGVDIDSGTVGLCDLSKDSTISRFSPLSGTSMATPHASGMLALMAEAYKKKIGKPLTLAEVKKMLESLQDHPKNNDAGWGVLSWSKIKEWAATEHGVEL